MDRSQDQRSHQQQHHQQHEPGDQEHEKIRRKITQILEEKRQIMKYMGREVQSCLSAAETYVNHQTTTTPGSDREIIDPDQIHLQLDECMEKLSHIRINFFPGMQNTVEINKSSFCRRRSSSQHDEEGEDEMPVPLQHGGSDDDEDGEEAGVIGSHNNDVIGKSGEAATTSADHFHEQQQRQQQDHHHHSLPTSDIPQSGTCASGVATAAAAAAVTSLTVISLGSKGGRGKESGYLEVVTDSSGKKNDCSTGSSLDSFERNENLIQESSPLTRLQQTDQQAAAGVQQQHVNHPFSEEGDSESDLFVIHHVDPGHSIDFVITEDSEEEDLEEEEDERDEEMDPEESGACYFTSPPPPPSSRRCSKFAEASDHHLPIRSLSLEDMTAKISAKRKSFDHRDSHSMDASAASAGSDEDIRLSLPEALEVQTSETAETVEHSDHPPDPRSHFLMERRSSLPRTQEVMNIPRLQGEQESSDNSSDSSGGGGGSRSLEDNCITLRSCDVATGKTMCDPLKPESLANTDTSAREAIISSVSSFATACSEIYSDLPANQGSGSMHEAACSSSRPPPQTEFDRFLTSSGLTPVLEIGNQSDDNEIGGHLRDENPLIVPIGSHVSVRICHINTPSDFYLHISRPAVDHFFDQMQVLQGKKVAHQRHKRLKEISIGLMYGIRSRSDSSWSRVKVIDLFHDASKNQGFAEVFFIDHGKTAKVVSDDLYCLDPNLLILPGQAVHCCLRQVHGPSGVWSLKAIEEFRNSVSYYSMRAVFYENGTTDKKYPVDLFLDWGADEMNNVLLYLSPTEFISQQSFEQSLSQRKDPTSLPERKAEDAALNFSISPCTVPVDKDYLLGLVSHVVSPSEFYLHIMSGEGNDHLDDLREHLNEHFHSKSLPVVSKFPTDLTRLKGSFWAAVSPNDNSWYRVRVTEVLEEEEDEPFSDALRGKHALVQYVDFGNVQIVPVADLKPLPPELSSIPALCVKCHLAHVTAFESVVGGERIWSDEALSHFHELCGYENETVVTLSIVHRPSHMDFVCSLPVLLWNNSAIANEDILVNALLVSENLAYTESTEWMEDVDRYRDLSPISRSDGHASPMSSPISFRQEFVPLKQLLIDSIILLKVTSATSPDIFHAILPYGAAPLDEVASMSCSETLHELIAIASEAPALQQLSRLMQDLKSCYDPKQATPSDHVHGTGSLVGCRSWTGDVFRGRVLSYRIGDGMYEVEDVDSGSASWVSGKRIFDLDPEFLKIPAFTVRCCLANVRPVPASSWSTDAVNVFREHTEDKFFAAHVVAVGDEDLRVELVGLDEENTISVCEYLVTLGFAIESPDDAPSGNNNVPVDDGGHVVTISKPPIPQRKKRPSLIEEET